MDTKKNSIQQQMLDRLSKHRETYNSLRLGFIKFLLDPLVEDRSLIDINFFKQGTFSQQDILEMFEICPEIKVDPHRGNLLPHPVKVVLLDLLTELQSQSYSKNIALSVASVTKTDLVMKLVVEKLFDRKEKPNPAPGPA